MTHGRTFRIRLGAKPQRVAGDAELDVSTARAAKTGSDVDLREEAGRRLSEAEGSRRVALVMAKRHQATNYVIGGLAVLLGSVGALAGLVSDDALWAGLFAAGAAATAGFQTLLRPQRMSDHHWTRYAALRRLADDYSALVRDVAEPTRGRLDRMAERREAIDRPPGD